MSETSVIPYDTPGVIKSNARRLTHPQVYGIGLEIILELHVLPDSLIYYTLCIVPAIINHYIVMDIIPADSWSLKPIVLCIFYSFSDHLTSDLSLEELLASYISRSKVLCVK